MSEASKGGDTAKCNSSATKLRRLSVSPKPEPALIARRMLVEHDKLVYVMVAKKPLEYKRGKSSIAYIGTTERGEKRVTESLAERADEIFALHGVDELVVRVITCTPRQRVKTWVKLESALLITFRGIHGQVPLCNTKGKKMKARDCWRYFSKKRIHSVIEELASK